MRVGLVLQKFGDAPYMRIVGDRLDPQQSDKSDWVGDRKGGSETRIEGTGLPVVGVFGNISDERHVQALGLIFARTASPAAPPPPPQRSAGRAGLGVARTVCALP